MEYTVLYSAPCVADAAAHGVPAVNPPPAPHCAHATEFVPVVAYEGLTAVPADPFAEFATLPHTSQFGQPRHVPILPDAFAAQPTHGVLPDALVPALPILMILAVPVRVSVPATYITYPAGLSVTPVFTVRLL